MGDESFSDHPLDAAVERKHPARDHGKHRRRGGICRVAWCSHGRATGRESAAGERCSDTVRQCRRHCAHAESDAGTQLSRIFGSSCVRHGIGCRDCRWPGMSDSDVYARDCGRKAHHQSGYRTDVVCASCEDRFDVCRSGQQPLESQLCEHHLRCHGPELGLSLAAGRPQPAHEQESGRAGLLHVFELR